MSENKFIARFERAVRANGYLTTSVSTEQEYEAAKAELVAALSPAPQMVGGKFALGDLVRKIRGSWWEGRVVGFYDTAENPDGVAVQLDKPNGQVQIYPAAAMELMPAPADHGVGGIPEVLWREATEKVERDLIRPSDEPERLWLSSESSDGHREVWFEPDEGGTTYVRADLSPVPGTHVFGGIVVPAEPTNAMLESGAMASCSLTEHGARGVYLAMIAEVSKQEFRPTSEHIELLQEALDKLGLAIDGEEALDVFSAIFGLSVEDKRKALSNVIHTRTERAAKAIYERIPYDGAGKKPKWVNGGNSTKQEEARGYARAALCTAAFAMAKGVE